jgi:UDP-2-acetamido-3-amino-2,3-dideoxy-glucuronate N-acetyltransferase
MSSGQLPPAAPIHATALVESDEIAADVRIGPFCHVERGAVIGRGSRLSEKVLVRSGAVVGEGVMLDAGAYVDGGVRIGAGVEIGRNVVLGASDGSGSGETVVGTGAIIGANSTIVQGIRVGSRAMVRPGAAVFSAVPPRAIVQGNPGQIIGYVDSLLPEADVVRSTGVSGEKRDTAVNGVTLHSLPLVHDLRGSLSVGLFGPDVPFIPRRYFLVFDVPSRDVRGEHAHRVCHQFLIATSGSVAIVVDDGTVREEIVLDNAGVGLYMPPMIWGIQYKYSADAVLLVFASEEYDPADYIRDYDQFAAEVGNSTRASQ